MEGNYPLGQVISRIEIEMKTLYESQKDREPINAEVCYIKCKYPNWVKRIEANNYNNYDTYKSIIKKKH